MMTKTIKTLLFASILATGLLATPMIMNAQANESSVMTRTISEQEVKETLEKALAIRSEQSKINDFKEGESLSTEDQSKMVQLENQIEPLLNVLAKYEQQNIERLHIEPTRKDQLQNILDDIRPRLAELANKVGISAYGANIDYEMKDIVIEVNDVSFNDQIQQILNDQPKDVDYRIEYRSFEDEACANKFHDCSPIVGGIAIVDEAPGGGCGLGLPVRQGFWPFYTYGFITAGHCAEDGDKLYQPLTISPATQIGDNADSRYETFCDCAWIPKTTGTTSNSKVWLNSNSYITVTKEQTTRPSIGDGVISFGLLSGVGFGTVTNDHDTFYKNGVNWDLVDTNIITSSGDSGSPYLGYDLKTIVGIHKSNSGTFTPWNEIDNRFGVSLH